ncbi:MAG: V-type ATPase subunit [Clostridiales bacterium]|nr:V-type ATPase subunit [Clostridiales bacterium]
MITTKIYANAVAKYNEGKLLGEEFLRRLADAEFSDAVRLLCEKGYGGGAADEKSYDADAFISRETAALLSYAVTDAPNEYLSRVLTNPFLYGNAKAYYKARYTGGNAAVYEMDDEAVRKGIESREYVSLPPFMADALAELDATFENEEPNPKTIDALLTNACYRDSLYCAKKSRQRKLVLYVGVKIDLMNLLSVLRARALQASWESVSPLIIEGGKRLKPEALQELFAGDDSVVPESYESLIHASGNLPQAEAIADDITASVFAADCENMQSYAPFIHYFTAQLSEYRAVKTILVCLKNNARDEIAARLRRS